MVFERDNRGYLVDLLAPSMNTVHSEAQQLCNVDAECEEGVGCHDRYMDKIASLFT